METPNVPGLFRQVFDAHDKAIERINTANAAMAEAATQFGIAMTAHGAANAEALAANRAALTLLYAWETDRDST
jgi:hypothetical protein